MRGRSFKFNFILIVAVLLLPYIAKLIVDGIFRSIVTTPTIDSDAIRTERARRDAALVENALIELKTLKAGTVSDETRSKLVAARTDHLKKVIRLSTQLGWNDDSSTREGCLMLEAQLTALAIGRGIVGSAEQVKERMEKLQSLLNLAGYEFDESGVEQKWDESGNRREGYTPLLDE